MKTIPIALAAAYALENSTICTCLKIEPKNPTSDSWLPIGITTIDVPVTVSGLLYRPGLDVTSIVSTAGLAVDNLDTSVIKINNILTDVDLLAGKLDGAAFTIFECNYLSPGDGINILKRGTIGQAQITQGTWTIEFRSNKQALQQPLGEVTSRTCRARLGDDLCTVDLAPFTFDGEIDSVTSNLVLADSTIAQVDDFFGEGEIEWTGGNNSGYSSKVKSFVGAGGTYTLSIPTWFEVQVGDTYTAIAGCRKRLTEDCLPKFANVLNFQGEPHLPGIDGLTAIPDLPDASP